MAEDDSSVLTAPKIVMKGFSLKSNSKSKTENSAGAKTVLGKRPRSALTSTHHSDSEDDDEWNVKHEEVMAFDASAGGAVRVGAEIEKKGPLVIERVKNTDWRSEARRRAQAAGKGKNLLPKEVQEQRAQQINGGTEMKEVESDVKWGLTITKKKTVEESNGGEEMVLDTTTTTTVEIQKKLDENGVMEMDSEKTADEKALDALLGKTPKAPDLIIHREDSSNLNSNSNDQILQNIPTNDTDAYRQAIALAPDVSTLDEYERIPVADFGAALLRGMGWKGETSAKGVKPKEVKRRPNLLGLGAKELGDAEELGAWVQKTDTKRLRPGGGDKKGGKGSRFVKPSDYVREKEREREVRDKGRERDGSGGDKERRRERDDGRYERRERERSREWGSGRKNDRDRDYRRR